MAIGAKLGKFMDKVILIPRRPLSGSNHKGVPNAESSRSVRGLGKGVSGKPYPRLCNARRPRLEPGTFRSQAVRLYRLHQARPSHSRSVTLLKLKSEMSESACKL